MNQRRLGPLPLWERGSQSAVGAIAPAWVRGVGAASHRSGHSLLIRPLAAACGHLLPQGEKDQ